MSDLEQNVSNGELIFRKAAIDALYCINPTETYLHIDDAVNAIKALPSAQQWIPCSERLPDTDDHVLCTTITRKGVRNIVRGYYFHDDSYPGGGQWSAGMNSNVIAWMPLPEPYQDDTP